MVVSTSKKSGERLPWYIHVRALLVLFVIPLIFAHLLLRLLVQWQRYVYGSGEDIIVFIPMQTGILTIFVWLFLLIGLGVLYTVRKRLKSDVPLFMWRTDTFAVTFVLLSVLILWNFFRSDWVAFRSQDILAGRDPSHFGIGAITQLHWGDAIDFWIADERPSGGMNPDARLLERRLNFYPHFELTMNDGRMLALTSTPLYFEVPGTSLPMGLPRVIQLAREKNIPFCIAPSTKHWTTGFVTSLPLDLAETLRATLSELPFTSDCSNHERANDLQLARPWPIVVKALFVIFIGSLFLFLIPKRWQKRWRLRSLVLFQWVTLVCFLLLLAELVSSY